MSIADHVSTQPAVLTLAGDALQLRDVDLVSTRRATLRIAESQTLADRMQIACEVVDRAIEEGWSVYGVTTGFGAMDDVPVLGDMAAHSQNNLLSFLSTGAGSALDRRHVRAAMALRANVMLRGCSGIRLELVERLVTFLNHDALPVVAELGSIGASGDLVPLSTIARAITGQAADCQVQIGSTVVDGLTALKQLGLQPIKLRPKEGLALVNGTSFSSAIAANSISACKKLMALTMTTNAIIMAALQVQQQPFAPFVHAQKPHPGQRWTAQTMSLLLDIPQPSNGEPLNGKSRSNTPTDSNLDTRRNRHANLQDRYAVRCFPQYMGAIVEGLTRIVSTVETEMNGVSDNPLIDSTNQTFYQSGNFLGQYIGIAMDDLRKYIGLMAKHLDVQIASLVAPEFNQGLPPSLQGNPDLPYNMGLKGLQITANSIMPMLTWQANPIVDHFPTHAEQFNQNINGLSWGSANLAWKSIQLLKHYSACAVIFAVQAIDLRSHQCLGHYDGRKLLSDMTTKTYEQVYQVVGKVPGIKRPLVFNDNEQSLQQWLKDLSADLDSDPSKLMASAEPIIKSFDQIS